MVMQDVQLITSANKHRFIVPGGVKQLTKEEFEAFTNQVWGAHLEFKLTIWNDKLLWFIAGLDWQLLKFMELEFY